MKITIVGKPVPQARFRSFVGRNRKICLYDPCNKEKTETKRYLESRENKVFGHPKISFLFHMPIPKSTPTKLAGAYYEGYFRHEKKPDIDNLIKFYLDCMDGIFFEGDQKVTLGLCIKAYHPIPKTIIFIEEMTEAISQAEQDYFVGLNNISKCS